MVSGRCRYLLLAFPMTPACRVGYWLACTMNSSFLTFPSPTAEILASRSSLRPHTHAHPQPTAHTLSHSPVRNPCTSVLWPTTVLAADHPPFAALFESCCPLFFLLASQHFFPSLFSPGALSSFNPSLSRTYPLFRQTTNGLASGTGLSRPHPPPLFLHFFVSSHPRSSEVRVIITCYQHPLLPPEYFGPDIKLHIILSDLSSAPRFFRW